MSNRAASLHRESIFDLFSNVGPPQSTITSKVVRRKRLRCQLHSIYIKLNDRLTLKIEIVGNFGTTPKSPATAFLWILIC